MCVSWQSERQTPVLHRPHMHQGNAESVSMNLGVLGTQKVPRKRFKALPVLAVSESQSASGASKLAESWPSAPFSHWPASRAMYLGRLDNACACNNQQFIQWYIARNFRPGAHRCASMDRGSSCNCSESLGSAWSGLEFHRSVWIARNCIKSDSSVATLPVATLKTERTTFWDFEKRERCLASVTVAYLI